MIRSRRNAKPLLCSAVACALVSAAGCASDNQPQSEGNDQGSASAEQVGTNATTVEARSAGLALGVARWEMQKWSATQGTVRGLNAADEVVAELLVDGDRAIIEAALPEHGVVSMFGDESDNTVASEYVKALKADLEQGSGKQPPENGEKGVFACYATYWQCEDAGWAGFLAGYWTAWTCHRPFYPCASHLTALYTD